MEVPPEPHNDIVMPLFKMFRDGQGRYAGVAVNELHGGDEVGHKNSYKLFGFTEAFSQ